MSELSRTAAAVGVLVAVAGCFGPDLSRCRVQCGAASACPSDQVCLSDNFCHGSSGDSLCASDDGGPGRDAADGSSDAGTPRPPTARGELIVTEIMKNPCAFDGLQCTVLDAQGEWFEIHNTTGDVLQLEGVEFNGTVAPETFAIAAAIDLDPGGHLVLGVEGDPALNGDIAVDYVYPPQVNLSNDSDMLVLRSPVSPFAILDEVNWSDTAMYPDEPGLAMSVDPDRYDAASNDLAASWCSSPAVLPSTDTGSPGARNPECP